VGARIHGRCAFTTSCPLSKFSPSDLYAVSSSSVRRRVTVGARLSLPHRARQLGRGGRALRRPVGAHRLTRGRHQSRPGHRGDTWCLRRPRRLARGSPRCAARRISTLLGCTRGTASQSRRIRRSPLRLRIRERDPSVRRFLERRQSALRV
jgi:hypothetical protein